MVYNYAHPSRSSVLRRAYFLIGSPWSFALREHTLHPIGARTLYLPSSRPSSARRSTPEQSAHPLVYRPPQYQHHRGFRSTPVTSRSWGCRAQLEFKGRPRSDSHHAGIPPLHRSTRSHHQHQTLEQQQQASASLSYPRRTSARYTARDAQARLHHRTYAGDDSVVPTALRAHTLRCTTYSNPGPNPFHHASSLIHSRASRDIDNTVWDRPANTIHYGVAPNERGT